MRPALEVINHLACITNDMEKTVRFYPDLLGMELFLGKGVDGFRHYIFRLWSQPDRLLRVSRRQTSGRATAGRAPRL